MSKKNECSLRACATYGSMTTIAGVRYSNSRKCKECSDAPAVYLSRIRLWYIYCPRWRMGRTAGIIPLTTYLLERGRYSSAYAQPSLVMDKVRAD